MSLSPAQSPETSSDRTALPASLKDALLARRSDVPGWVRLVFALNLIFQISIVGTGGAVRLTGSGLGCPTWPQCVPGSYIPTVEQAEGFHKYIEFGNRAMTFVLSAAAVAVLVAAVYVLKNRSRGFKRLAAVPLIFTAVQALVGGAIVHTDLNPNIVAPHFLISMILVASSTVLLLRLDGYDGPAHALVRREVLWLYWLMAAVAVAVIVLGTIVTGAGPHSGDADAPNRINIDPRTVSWIHADAVMLFVGLLLGFYLCLRLLGVPGRVRTAAKVLIAVTLAQGLIGYVQYFNGLPELLVGMHMIGASLLTMAIAAVGASLFVREPGAAASGEQKAPVVTPR